MRIYSRAEWGARYRAGAGAVALPVPELWLHHTVTSAPRHDFAAEFAAMRQVEAIGQSRFGQGISYTFAVMPSGRVYEGTGAGRLGAHTGGRNSRSHAIVLVGNYDSVVPSDAVLNGVATLVRYGHGRRWWVNNRLSGGHRDVKATGCPGNRAYALIGEINRRAASGQVETQTITPTPAPIEEDDEMVYLFWSENVVRSSDGHSPSAHGLHPNRIAYIEKNLRHKWLPDPPGGRGAKHEMAYPAAIAK